MKKLLLVCVAILLNLGGPVQATQLGGDWPINAAIPEGSPVGITESQSFQNYSAWTVASVDVSLDISGGYNGSLYGYLAYQDSKGNTATEILLNQVGTSPSNPFGSSGSGFSNITLSDSGTVNGSIHNATGIPTGTWLPDSPDTLNGTFGGMSADGTWTLFLADLTEGGGTSTLNSWGLEVTVVPEPSPAGLMAMGLSLIIAYQFLGRWRTSTVSPQESRG